MPVPKFKVLRSMCKDYDLTPCKMRKIIAKHNPINAMVFAEILKNEYSIFMDQFHAQYILLEKQYLY